MSNSVPDYISNAEVEDWFDSIDAAVFSGDTFYDKANRERARWYVLRWLREFGTREIDDQKEDK